MKQTSSEYRMKAMMQSVYDSLSRDTATVAESLSIMIKKEQKHGGRRNYLGQSTVITSSDRRKMVDWCYAFVDTLKFDRETIALVRRGEMNVFFLGSRVHFFPIF